MIPQPHHEQHHNLLTKFMEFIIARRLYQTQFIDFDEIQKEFTDDLHTTLDIRSNVKWICKEKLHCVMDNNGNTVPDPNSTHPPLP